MATCCGPARPNQQPDIARLEEGRAFQADKKTPCARSLTTHIALTALAMIAVTILVLGALAFSGDLNQVISFVNKHALWFAMGAGLVFVATFATGIALLSNKTGQQK
jgi:hypothetical protein